MFCKPNMLGELVWLRLCSHSSLRSLSSMSLLNLRVLEIHGSGKDKHQNLNELDSHSPPRSALEIRGSFENAHRNLNVLDPHSPPRSALEIRGSVENAHRNLNVLDPHSPPPYALTERQQHSSTKVKRAESSRQSSLIPLSRATESSFHGFLADAVNGMITLTKLVLNNLGFLQSLPIDFSQLPNLRHLNLSGCSQLTELPNTFPKLLQLRYLALQYCSNLSIPFDILGEISTLEYVDFKGCAKLVCLPERIPYQRLLRYLNLLETGLLQLPDNLGSLDKLEQIIIGSPALKQISLTVANLKGLAELFLIQCSGLQQISPEGIAAPNIKILAIDGGPIDDFSFHDQGNLDAQNIHSRVGMLFLRDLILTNTFLSEITIPDCVTPRLETINLSGNIRLMRVNVLPSTLVSLNLQNCCGLKTLTSLSNLVNLKFLNTNRCFNLQILNTEGLEALEEIKAEECWELQRIQGLNQRERLNCVHISTDKAVMLEDIGEFFGSPSHQVPSSAIFSGKVDKMLDREDIMRIAEKLNLRMLRKCSWLPASEFVNMRAILVCFTSHYTKSQALHVTFQRYSQVLYHRWTWRPETEVLKYSIITGNRGGTGLHLFMWTDESHLYSVSKHDIYVNFGRDGAKFGEEDDRAWIVGVDKKTNVSQVCRELIMACV